MNYRVRKALEADSRAITDVIMAAFGNDEGELISQLVTDLQADPTAQPPLSLVATADNSVVGHILFTSACIRHLDRKVSSSLLAPLAVHPECQGLGIGGQLINEGLRQLGEGDTQLVFVLGHPDYYPRYGFSPAGTRGLDAPYPILPENADAWMVQELQPGVIGSVSGQLVCAETFAAPALWQE
ncbi:GNAT family N-acetyltransferase [Solemya velum gill symbiont]|uniref:GNAT family N-acetyltransferase n=1 Tax=Solemya velum gill symbiont TaxID=2340 RepID=UPI0009989BD4|nr:N-acetyltransferase [Solemya velum gill symbiont]OOZ13265.1 GNAT family N-acetyltransferase [Solemya velum gill symbiont]